jgi:hypothetical protein
MSTLIWLCHIRVWGVLVSTRSTLTTLVTLVSYPPVVATGRWDTENFYGTIQQHG